MWKEILKSFRNEKKKGVLNNHRLNVPRNLARTHDFYKGLAYDNSYPAISRIANEFMTIKPYMVDNNGKTVKESNVLNKIYHPNQQMSGASFREALAILSLVHSKVYVLAWSYDEHGVPATGREITPENLAGFTILEGVAEYRIGDTKRYRVGAKEYGEFEVLELRSGINPYDLSDGFSPTNAVQKWANIDDYIASYQAGLFENGAVPAGQFVITAGTVEDFNAIVDGMEAQHRGSGKNNNVMYVHRPIEEATGKAVNSQIEWLPFAQANKDLNLQVLFEQANKKIDSVYGVPASVRGVNDNNTYASVRVDEQIFIKYTIRPFATRLWGEFTHQLNRILGGFGEMITFDLEIPNVADEAKIKAEKKRTELELIKSGLEMGYTLDSLVDAFELSNGYKTLKMGEKAPKIENDKPEVDDGGEVGDSPEDLNMKSAIKECKHCLKVKSKTKSEKINPELEKRFAEMMNAQLESAIKADFADLALPEGKKADFEKAILAVLMAEMLKSGKKEFGDFKKLLAENGVSVEDLVKFKLSDQLVRDYTKMTADFTRSFNEDTANAIMRKIKQAEVENLTKNELEREIREISNAEKWRIKRIARTETHRAQGLAGVDAGVQIQNATGARIYKEWTITSPNPCKYCQGMRGRRVNIAESYLKKGGVFIEKKIRVNDYADIDTAGAHPNCSCRDVFGVEGDGVLENTQKEVIDNFQAD